MREVGEKERLQYGDRHGGQRLSGGDPRRHGQFLFNPVFEGEQLCGRQVQEDDPFVNAEPLNQFLFVLATEVIEIEVLVIGYFPAFRAALQLFVPQFAGNLFRHGLVWDARKNEIVLVLNGVFKEIGIVNIYVVLREFPPEHASEMRVDFHEVKRVPRPDYRGDGLCEGTGSRADFKDFQWGFAAGSFPPQEHDNVFGKVFGTGDDGPGFP